jgi:hypothetical protein
MYPQKVQTLIMLHNALYGKSQRDLETERMLAGDRTYYPPSVPTGKSEEDGCVGLPYCVAEYDKDGWVTYRDPTPEEIAVYHERTAHKKHE